MDAGNDGVHDASADSALLSNAFPELSFHILPRFQKNINMLGCVSLPATSLSPTHPSGQYLISSLEEMRPSSTCGSLPCKHYPTMTLLFRTYHLKTMVRLRRCLNKA
nr:uncharacterized protein LOC109741435 isoform X3 [Aegilops tauschii subsp. strangulata]